MQESFTLYASAYRENVQNVYYPQKVVVSNADDLTGAVVHDHVAAMYRGNHRGNDRFIQSDCLMLDLDNTHTDDPSGWKSLNDIEAAFPGVAFYAVESRNHMRVKNGAAARPKYHFYYPINTVTDARNYKRLKEWVISVFPYFDSAAKDSARSFFGVENPKVYHRVGKITVDAYLILYAPVPTTHHADNAEDKQPVAFGRPISAGERNNELYRYAFKQYMKGLSCEEVHILTGAYNSRLEEPLDTAEITNLVNSACSKEVDRESINRKAEVVMEFAEAAAESKANTSSIICLADIEEREPEWLIEGYIPKGEITVLAGDGGVGKTFVWCAIVAAISSGNRAFVLNNSFTEDAEQEPRKVMYFSSEDSNEAVLRARLRNSGANLSNIITIDSAHKDFQEVKLNSAYLENLIDRYRPALVVFDPLQSFLPPKTEMRSRAEMREVMAKLHVYGKNYGATFLIIMHTNKQQNVWGRTRLADSADIWDIARSVLICGEADSKSHLKYLSQEKSSYGKLSQTVLFRIEGNTAAYAGYTEKRDRDYVREASKTRVTAPEREAATRFILEYLQDHGEVPVGELDAAAVANGFSEHTLRRAKEQLKADGKTQIHQMGDGAGKGVKWYVSLTHTTSGQIEGKIQ